MDSDVTPPHGTEPTIFTCPAQEHPFPLDTSRLLSTHPTSHGLLAYFRCVCDGLVIAAQPTGHVISHATGSGTHVAASPAPIQACA